MEGASPMSRIEQEWLAPAVGPECQVDRLRVLHVIGGLGPGGAETLLYRPATRVEDADHQIICLGPRDWYSPRLEEQGIPVEHLDMSGFNRALHGSVRLRSLIRSS